MDINNDISEHISRYNDSDALEILKFQYKRYIRNKIIMERLQVCAQTLVNELGDKVRNIIVGSKLKQCLKLDDSVVLDIKLDDFKPGYEEREKLKQVLQENICDNHIKLFDDFKRITLKDLKQVYDAFSPPMSLFDLSLTDTEDTTLYYRRKLAKEQENLKDTISARLNAIENLVEFRLMTVPKSCNRANSECEAMIECNFLKSKIVEYKTKMDIFLEIPVALKAYKELLKDIKNQKEETELAIENMRENKKKYENVLGKEYNQILQSYLMYTNSINKLKKMYDIVS